MSASQDGMLLSREGMLDKLFADMYWGNGKPALTVRVATVEQDLADIKKLLNKALWLLLGTLATSTATVIVEIFVKVMK